MNQEVEGQILWTPALQEDFWVTKAQWGCSLCWEGQLWVLLQLSQEQVTRIAKALSTSSARFKKEPILPQLCPLIFLKEIIPTRYNWESILLYWKNSAGAGTFTQLLHTGERGRFILWIFCVLRESLLTPVVLCYWSAGFFWSNRKCR